MNAHHGDTEARRSIGFSLKPEEFCAEFYDLSTLRASVTPWSVFCGRKQGKAVLQNLNK